MVFQCVVIFPMIDSQKKVKNNNKRKKINKNIIVFCESNFLFYFHYVGFSILLPILMFGCMSGWCKEGNYFCTE